MRKLIVCNMMSLDGYYAGTGHDIMALFEFRHDYPTDDTFDQYNAERLRAADTLLVGRKSYNDFKSYWPNIADDPNQPPVAREISRLDNMIEKVVVSDSLTPDQTTPWADTTRIVRRADAHEQIKAMKQQDGKDILMFGSHTLWNDLLAHGLVDELHLMIGPILMGEGVPIFTDKVAGSLRRLDAPHSREGSGIVLVKYSVIEK